MFVTKFDSENARDCCVAFALLFAAYVPQRARKQTSNHDRHHRPSRLAQKSAGTSRCESVARGYQDPHFVEAKPSFFSSCAAPISSSSSDLNSKSAGFPR